MRYTTTRNTDEKKTLSSSQTILKGLGNDGGLYIPEIIPKFSLTEIEAFKNKSYQEKAMEIFKKFLTDFTDKELINCINDAYNLKSFSSIKITPLHKLTDKNYVLELYHGPTYAFKDIALQILPYFLTTSAKKNNDERTYVILVATSGDTGKAALEGFKDVPGTKVLVFYPNNGVSNIQKLQMATQEGRNVNVLAVEGNFDDTQTIVKALFSNINLNQRLKNNNYTFSSANSINWGRLLPQIVYYFESYLSLVNEGTIKMGAPLNFSVPTGNFGNILSGYFAKKMGLPIKTLICATNSNNILDDFIKTGTYNKNRPFYKTMSPSMDILISSNIERLLYILSDCNGNLINLLMKNLNKKGTYTISNKLLKKIKESFWSGFCSEKNTLLTIENIYKKYNYLIDTHTAVAQFVYEQYRKSTKDTASCVVVSTASPYKFNNSVAKALMKNTKLVDEIILLNKVSEFTGIPIPRRLDNLNKKEIRFKNIINKDKMLQSVLNFLKI